MTARDAHDAQDFSAFLRAMEGLRLLHLGHKDADCDALASAYAMSRVLPGDVGFAQGLKTSARDLALWLECRPQIDPDPAAYDFVIIYDTNSPALLGLPVPEQYALIDHHVPGGHRYSDFQNQLVAAATWAWVRPLESTCSVLADLFAANSVPTTRKVQIALAAGIVTDTAWLEMADGAALRRLAAVLEPSNLYLEDVYQAIDTPFRRASRRSAVLTAVRGVHEVVVGHWSVLAADTDAHDHGFAVASALRRLGGDVCAVAFPKGDRAMVMVECGSVLTEQTGIDLSRLLRSVGQRVSASDCWGTRIFGRIIAPVPLQELLHLCVAEVAQSLAGSQS
jgi:nanoRNase/pAp phosphatase (c-di-AMP/oligoRNAs hydrolase)